MATTKKSQRKGKKPMGRPKGSVEKLRRNRVVIMLTDSEVEKLQRLATARGLPLGTHAYDLLSSALRRAR